MKKKVISLMLALTLLLSAIPAFAAADRESERANPVEDPAKYTEVATVSPGLSVSGKTASCSVSISGTTKVTKISATLQLQKKNSSGTYVNYGTSWKAESKSNYLYHSTTKTVDTGGTYRLKVSAIASYSNGSSLVTAYS